MLHRCRGEMRGTRTHAARNSPHPQQWQGEKSGVEQGTVARGRGAVFAVAPARDKQQGRRRSFVRGQHVQNWRKGHVPVRQGVQDRRTICQAVWDDWNLDKVSSYLHL
jgi:hypothetical protein